MLMLPDGEVAVLHSQRQKRGSSPLMESRVENGQFTQKDIQRPAIRDDVMERDGQGMVSLIQLKKLRPPQRSACEVERNARVLRKQTREPVCACTQIAIDQRKVHLRVDGLHWLSIVDLKGSAQCFVATRDLIQRADQRAAIERAFQSDGNWDVVRRRGAEALQKPEPALSERERHPPCTPG